jgi:uncharacterized membrane protein YfcA
MDLQVWQYALAALAAVGAGFVNALAGGGTLITFPTLIGMGLLSVPSNVTNTVALLPGYIGGTLAQRKFLEGQRKRLLMLLPAGALGGLVGGFLLLLSGEKLFSFLVPFLILLASILLALQDPMRLWLQKRLARSAQKNLPESTAILPVAGAAVYGGYFGAGLSVIILATLGLVLEDTLTRLNAIKQFISFSANLAAAVYFAFSGEVVWSLALVMAVGALAGGALGGKLANVVKPSTLRWIVVSIGVVVSLIYFYKNFFAS